MNIDQLTIAEAREIARIFSPATAALSSVGQPYAIGKNYFIRTVTHHYTGKLVEVHPVELVLEDAAWIADDGRFAQAVASGDFAEIEPYPKGRVIIGRNAVLDACEISKLNLSQK